MVKIKPHNMKKIALFIAISFAFIACETENETINNEQNLSYDALSEDNSLGKYKGVFTTLDSESRAKVDITIKDATNFVEKLITQNGYKSTATFTFENGTAVDVFATKAIELGEGINNLEFVAENISFLFSVNDDGTNPTLTNVIYNNKPSAVLIKKHTNRAPVDMITGTYACVECQDHPNLNAGMDQTFNIVLTDNGDGTSIIDTQVLLGSSEYLGLGDQNNCNTNGVLTTCNIEGVFDAVGGTSISWDGSHDFNNEAAGANDCSDFDGTWSWITTNYGTISGTFASSVTSCNPQQQVFAVEDFDGGTPAWSNMPSIPYFNTENGSDYFGPSDGTAGQNSGSINYLNISENFLYIQDLNSPNGTTGFADVVFADVNVANATGITLSFDYDVVGFDGGDNVNYTLTLDGAEQTEVGLIIGMNSPNSVTEEGTISLAIPDGTTTLGFKLSVKQNGGNDYAGFDNFKIEGVQ